MDENKTIVKDVAEVMEDRKQKKATFEIYPYVGRREAEEGEEGEREAEGGRRREKEGDQAQN
jgi:hypothetical protein